MVFLPVEVYTSKTSGGYGRGCDRLVWYMCNLQLYSCMEIIAMFVT